MAGYSGTPLAKKLGIGPDAHVVLLDAPVGARDLLGPLPLGVDVESTLGATADVVVAFVTKRSELEHHVREAGAAIHPAGGLWIAWPKRASKVPTEVTEDVVREVALPTGLVDNKVCAFDETWSALRLVWRVEHRGSRPGV